MHPTELGRQRTKMDKRAKSLAEAEAAILTVTKDLEAREATLELQQAKRRGGERWRPDFA